MFFAESIKSVLRFFIIKKLSISTNSRIDASCKINFKTILEGKNTIHKKACISSSLVGYATFIGLETSLPMCKIGKYCSIADNVKIVIGKHPSKKFVSTHPSFFSLKKQSGFTYVKQNKFDENSFCDENNSFYCCIGNDVWIGSGVKIMAGVKIPDGVIIGAGAVVTKDLEPYFIYGGVPAKKIGQRFNDKEIEYLMNFKWWDKPESWIKANSHLFSDIEEFIQLIK